MNSTGTTVGGWEKCSMRYYLNNNIYNSLEDNLKKVISETSIVSGHDSNGTEDFKTKDKLYLLSAGEVWIPGEFVYYDSASSKTRQLDYYEGVGAWNNRDRGAKRGSNPNYWWLRSARNNDFYFMGEDGLMSYQNPLTAYGVSPAFRIG